MLQRKERRTGGNIHFPTKPLALDIVFREDEVPIREATVISTSIGQQCESRVGLNN